MNKLLYFFIKVFTKTKNKSLDITKIEKVLCFTPMGIGNALMLLPTLQLLKNQLPHSELDIVTISGAKELYQNSVGYRNLFFWNHYKKVIDKLIFFFNLRKNHYQFIIFFYPFHGMWSKIFMFMYKNAYVAGFHYVNAKEKNYYDFSFLYNYYESDREKKHDIVRNYDFLSNLLNIKEKKIRNELILSEKIKSFGIELKRKLSISNNHSYLIGFSIGSKANNSYKRWDTNQFIVLGNYLTENYPVQILLLFGPDEKEISIQAAKKINNCYINENSISLMETASIIQVCDGFVSNDSALMHFASFLNVPTIGIFGPTDEVRTSPFGNHCTVIRSYSCPFQPCYNKGVPSLCRNQYPLCLKSISVQDVIKCVEEKFDFLK